MYIRKRKGRYQVQVKRSGFKPKVSMDHNGNMKFKNKVDEEIYRIKKERR